MKHVKKVMLITPPVTRPKSFSAKVSRVTAFFPLGMAYLASALEANGEYKIEVLDSLLEGDYKEGVPTEGGAKIRYGLTDDEIINKIEKFAPDVVGVSCLFSGVQEDAAHICSLIKRINSNIQTIIGGAHAGNMPEELLHLYKDIDFVVIGESEISFLEIVEALKTGNNISKIDGISFRKEGEIIVNPKTKYIEDLDSISFPAYHLFNMPSYLNNAESHGFYRYTPYTQMVTSRGCPCKCSFCALGAHWGPRQRLRSANNVLDEIEYLIKTYGIKEIHFEDDNLTADKERANELLDGIIARKLDIKWHAPSGMAAYTLNEELIEKMAASGCYSVTIAIESGNQHVVSSLMNKPINLKVIPNLVKKIRENGMDVRGFFMLGFPGETQDNINETINFAKNIELDWAYFSIFSPLPKTKIYELCLEKGYIKDGDFDPIRSFHRSIIHTPEFTPEYLDEIREKAIIETCFKYNPNLLKYDIDKAIESFRSVVRRYPHFDFANYYLAEAYLKKKSFKKAAEFYRITQELSPGYENVIERLSALSDLTE